MNRFLIPLLLINTAAAFGQVKPPRSVNGTLSDTVPIAVADTTNNNSPDDDRQVKRINLKAKVKPHEPITDPALYNQPPENPIFLNNYAFLNAGFEPLECTGKVPADFTTTATEQYRVQARYWQKG